jgi:hypothetical protein
MSFDNAMLDFDPDESTPLMSNQPSTSTYVNISIILEFI